MTASSREALEKVNELISSFLRRYGYNFLGAVVFGSLAKGTWRKNSDVDIMLLFNECDYSRNFKIYDGLKFEIYNMPAKIFFSPFSGGRRNLFFDMFRLQVLRTGKVLYEKDYIISRVFAMLSGRKIPHEYVGEALNKAHGLANAAERYLYRGSIEGAELKLLDASINFARALLMKMNIPEINTPRLLIPHMRGKSPDFYGVFREICGLKGMGRGEVEARIVEVKETLNNIRRKFGKNMGLKGVINKAESELSSAEDCLEVGDHDSAALQAEYAQSIIMKNMPVRSKLLTCTLMHRNLEKGEIKEYVKILKEMKEKYF
ncbi:MAG: nucleotidyltransferase domain-containing protein [Candidatus Bathyarchaeia archaeon]